MRDGSGDEYFIVFSAAGAGACVRGLGHESVMSPCGNDGKPWPGVIDDVLEVFKSFVEEPAFTDEDGVPAVTVCLWREETAEDYYEVSVDLAAVSDLYALRPLSQELVSSLNSEVTLADLAQVISEIGYPQDL